MKKQDMFKVTYGSKLYGTSTPTSDTDEKVVYLPDLQDLLLLTKLPIFKQRFDAEGNSIGDGFTMPDNGVETEYFPLQTFVRDFVAGQTYAVEIAFAFAKQDGPVNFAREMVQEMVQKFANAEVYSMVGFAMKQTFDYVKRGERLNDAQKVLDVVDKYTAMYSPNESAVFYTVNPRLDTVLDGKTLLEHLAADTGLETEVLTNGKKPQNSLKLNGRFYLETTTLSHFREQVVKIIKSFGVRSVEASLTSVEWKSLSHALRVYQQAIELLDTGNMTFPRPNAEYLLSVKQGKENIEEVKAQLLALDDEVQKKILSSTMQKRTPELIAASEEWLLNVLMDLYKLEKK
jgi:predicted nucleotidyltransferase